eukprot:COSAG01_NODE_6410_length_3681_cov_11.529592_4_plen_534_part_01
MHTRASSGREQAVALPVYGKLKSLRLQMDYQREHSHSPRVPESSQNLLVKSQRQSARDPAELMKPLRSNSHGSASHGKKTLALSPGELKSSNRHRPTRGRFSPKPIQPIPESAQRFIGRSDVDLRVRRLRTVRAEVAGLAKPDVSLGSVRKPQAMQVAMREARRQRLATLLMAARKRIVAAGYVKGGISATQLFRHYDRDNDNELSLQEWGAALRKAGKLDINILSDGELRTTFEIADTDQDGGINLCDFRAFLRPAIQHERQPPAVRARLEARDDAFASSQKDVRYRQQLQVMKMSKLVGMARAKGLDAGTLVRITSSRNPRELAIDVLVDLEQHQAGRGASDAEDSANVEGVPLKSPHDYVRARAGMPASVRVTCPELLGPGDALTVMLVDGRMRSIVVPEDVYSGESFEIVVGSDFAPEVSTDDEFEESMNDGHDQVVPENDREASSDDDDSADDAGQGVPQNLSGKGNATHVLATHPQRAETNVSEQVTPSQKEWRQLGTPSKSPPSASLWNYKRSPGKVAGLADMSQAI